MWRIEQKTKRKFLTALATAINKELTTSIEKNFNEQRVYEKTVRTAVKQNLSPDLKPLDYAIWSVLEN